MRQVLLLSVLFLGVTWASAQTSPSQSSSPDASPTAAGQTSASSSHTSVEGCLSGSDGKYTLTDKAGTAYNLTGDTSKLAEHVGHEIKVTGSAGAGASGASGSSAASAGSAAGGQSLDVSSVKMVSKTCDSGGGMAK